jgi:hypothetical protein
MNQQRLPPVLEAYVADYADSEDFDIVWYTFAIAHEACRLQREADNLSQDAVRLTTPLVVGKLT